MGFNLHLPSGTMSENIKFDKVYQTEKVLHVIQRCVSLHIITDFTNYFVKGYAREAHNRGISRSQPNI